MCTPIHRGCTHVYTQGLYICIYTGAVHMYIHRGCTHVYTQGLYTCIYTGAVRMSRHRGHAHAYAQQARPSCWHRARIGRCGHNLRPRRFYTVHMCACRGCDWGCAHVYTQQARPSRRHGARTGRCGCPRARRGRGRTAHWQSCRSRARGWQPRFRPDVEGSRRRRRPTSLSSRWRTRWNVRCNFPRRTYRRRGGSIKWRA